MGSHSSGVAVGPPVGETVGPPEGEAVGEAVGPAEGDEVGELVGSLNSDPSQEQANIAVYLHMLSLPDSTQLSIELVGKDESWTKTSSDA